ncbi:MAG: 2-dehydropantoate 2-reductase [Desulfobulbaceae bacterium]|nr:2-dehydropantoate 2-reductase [Desulfobulbaceae bacterium]
MKIVIIGPGALGSLFAALLAAEGKNDVWLLDHNAARAHHTDGKLLLTLGKQEFCRFVSVTADVEKIGPTDIVLNCVKSQDVASALQRAHILFTPQTVLVSFQNGISHFDILASLDTPAITAIGVTAMGATLKEPGHVVHGGHGLTRIGLSRQLSLENHPEADILLSQLVDIFNNAGLETKKVSHIIDFVWAKLLVNVGINALTAIFDCENGRLLDIPQAREKMIEAVQEGERVARALGIKISEDPVAQTIAVCRATANNISSMLQDVLRQRPTEIEAINGALLQKATQLGMDAPVNRELVLKIREIEAGYRPKEPQRPAPDHL